MGEALFFVLPVGILAYGVYTMGTLIRRAREVRAAWNSGLTAEARCVRMFVKRHSEDRSTLHHIYEFTARDGRAVRFEEKDGPETTLQGDIVTVFYTAEDPERATVRPPHPGMFAAFSGGALVRNVWIIAFCVFFIAAGAWGLS
ncbi:DUF3592 domain-containing protein [Streptomyces sp. Y7]|uniref:DUF3592 domain-containing protein n=1 Tax=Streptomyces sp. Y7 TaxID=3342392 RepID=UPI0037160CBA